MNLTDSDKSNIEKNFAKVIIPGSFQRTDAGGLNYFKRIGKWEFTINYKAIEQFDI